MSFYAQKLKPWYMEPYLTHEPYFTHAQEEIIEIGTSPIEISVPCRFAMGS